MGFGLLKGDRNCSDRPPVAVLTKICKFQHKNGNNSGCIRHNEDTGTHALGGGYSESAHLSVSHKFAQTDPCCNGNDYKYKPIFNDSAPVNISETDKTADFKCGTVTNL